MDKYIDRFLAYVRCQKAGSATTIKTYRAGVRSFLDSVNIDTPKQITIGVVDDYINLINLAGLKPKTIRNKIVIVRCFVKFLYSRNIIDLRPEAIELPKNKSIEANFLSPTELAAFLSVIKSKRDFAMFLLIAVSGLRVSELNDLKLRDIYGLKIIINLGKGGKNRSTYMTQQAKSAIEHYLRDKDRSPEDYIFKNKDGEQISRAYIWRICKIYAEKAKITHKVSPHTLRHTFATIANDSGIEINELQRLMGHANINTTTDYVHLSELRVERSYYDHFNFDFNSVDIQQLTLF